MQYYTKQTASDLVAKAIENAAKNGQILLLLSGGSSAAIGVGALKILPASTQQNITVMLADERYVPYNSASSNSFLLKGLNINDYCSKFIEVLDEHNNDSIDVTEMFRQNLARQMYKANSLIAVFGVGTDNHIAGILPETVAATSADEFALYYETPQFERITISPNVFSKIDGAFLYAEGPSKEAAARAVAETHDPVTHPSQLIKLCKNWHIMYNMGEM